MRIKALLLVTALGASALPASAQAYNQDCRDRQENRAGGAILGAIVGGVLGSNVAARGHRGDGTAVGGLLGGVIGSEIGRGATRCPTTYGSVGQPNYPVNSYPANTYPAQPPYPQSYPDAGAYPPPPADYGYYPDDRYANDTRYRDEDYGRGKVSGKHRKLDADDRYTHNRNGEYAGRDCDDAIQITRLPDGTEIRRPVEACRNSYYGDWHVRD
jgi:hypothetical protein